ncbi:hypothetical protein LINPERHAP2_LOCUS38335 [Linum perenne]
MYITVHFIGHEWKLHKKVISFSQITSHKGSDIGAGIAICLDEWGLKRLFTVTVDNASANDFAIKRVREAVRWVRASSAREECFRNVVAIRKMKCKKMPLLDVPTRWNSTFSMMDTVSAYEK